MDKETLAGLTSKLYKITIFFPKKEPLRYKMREVANEVLTNLVSLEALQRFNPGNLATDWEKRYKDLIFLINKDLEVLKGYFEIAKWQNWVNYFDILEIEKEYDKIRFKMEEEIRDFKLMPEDDEGEELSRQEVINLPKIKEKKIKEVFISEDKEKQSTSQIRKEKILEILEKKGKVQVWEVNKILPQVSKRTLRRDFDKLLKQGIVERIGKRNNTFYQLKNRT